MLVGCRYHTGMADSVVNWDAVECVMLDMDGTVLDLAFDNYYWAELLPRRYAARHGLSVEASRVALAPIFESEYGGLNWYCLDFWSARTGLDMTALKRGIRDRIAVLPGAVAFLDAVRASGRELWLATNAHPDSWQLKMEQTGLAGRFDHIICAHDYGAAKEQPCFWPRLRAQHPFDPARTVFVDDNLTVLATARDYGVAQVLAIRRPNTQQPLREVQVLPAVDALVDLLPMPALRAVR